MKASICFTGVGEVRGIKIKREEWETASFGAGYLITDNGNCAILIASRSDTMKAKNAAAKGATIMTYEEWAGQLYMDGVFKVGEHDVYQLVHGTAATSQEALRQAAKENVEAKKRLRMAQIAADKARAEKELAELEQNPMFGMF